MYPKTITPTKGNMLPSGLGSSESGKASKAAKINPTTNPIKDANRLWVDNRFKRVRRARTGRVVIKGVRISPNKAPTRPNVNAYCSTEKVPGLGAMFAACPSEAPQYTPTIENTTIPIKRVIKSVLIEKPPNNLIVNEQNNEKK